MPTDEDLLKFMKNQTNVRWHLSKSSNYVTSKRLTPDKADSLIKKLNVCKTLKVIPSTKKQGTTLLKISKKDILKMKNKQDRQGKSKIKEKSEPKKERFKVINKEVAKVEIPLEAGTEINIQKAYDSLMALYKNEDTLVESFAEYLHKNSQRLNHTAVGGMLIHPELLKKYTERFNFQGQDFFTAVKEFFSKFILTGDKKDDRLIIEAFAKKYHEQNKDLLNPPDILKIQNFRRHDAIALLTEKVIILNKTLIDPSEQNMDEKTFQTEVSVPLQLTRQFHQSAFNFLEKLYTQVKTNPIRQIEDMISNLKIRIESQYISYMSPSMESNTAFLNSWQQHKNAFFRLYNMVDILDKVKQEPEALADALDVLQREMNAIQSKIQNKIFDSQNKYQTKDQKTLLKVIQEIQKNIAPIISENNKRMGVDEKDKKKIKKV